MGILQAQPLQWHQAAAPQTNAAYVLTLMISAML
jgi:hypothetical protein